MNRLLALVVLFAAGPACAAPMAGDAAFAAQAREGLSALRLPQTTRALADSGLEKRLDERLGWYDALEAQPAFGAAALSALIVDALRRGERRSLILGETHGVPVEQAAARGFVGALLDAGVPVGVFLREENLYPETGPLAARRVPVLTYRNQFEPEADVKAALKAAKGKLLISYTGAAHTAQHPKDYFQNTLLEAIPFGYGPGLKDMPTVEDSLERRGLKPLIVAMLAESHAVERIQHMFLKDLPEDSSDLPALRRNLDALLSLWSRRLARWPSRAEPIVFARDPRQADVIVGLTPGERRPLDLVAAAQVLALPEAAAWLGAARLTSVESLAGSSSGADGRVTERHWDVVLHAAGRANFQRTIAGDVVLAAAP
jgi:hypothetical protein